MVPPCKRLNMDLHSICCLSVYDMPLHNSRKKRSRKPQIDVLAAYATCNSGSFWGPVKGQGHKVSRSLCVWAINCFRPSFSPFPSSHPKSPTHSSHRFLSFPISSFLHFPCLFPSRPHSAACALSYLFRSYRPDKTLPSEITCGQPACHNDDWTVKI